VLKVVCSSVKNIESDISNNLKQIPKKFWNYVKTKTRFYHQVTELFTYNEPLCTSNADKANVLNKTFSDVLIIEKDEEILCKMQPYLI